MRSALLIAVLFLCSCGQSFQAGPGDSVALEVRPQTVSAGEAVSLVLTNGSSSEVGYNLCSSGLEQLVEGDWRSVPSDRVCTMELRTLAAGDEVTYPMDVPASLSTGEYRYTTSVHRTENAESTPVRSQSFRITG